MSKQIKIASWNIAGGRTTDSLEQFDYDKEDLNYFADRLRELDADYVCLQEIHLNKSRSIARELSDLLGYKFVYEIDVSPSHIDNDYRLGNAILSKFSLMFVADEYYPFPKFELRFSNGKIPTGRHDKMVQIYKSDQLMIANTQMLPLEIFGYSYTEGDGARLAHKIDNILTKALSTPLIFCGDFNFNQPEQAYPNLIQKLSLKNVLPEGFTRPPLKGRSRSPDHIYVSEGINCIDSRIIQVNADHYLCYCLLEY